MKKLIILVALAFLAVPTQTSATHLMGGEITARPDSAQPNNYIITLTLYRDALGVSLGQNATVQVDWGQWGLQQLNLPRLSVDSIFLNPVYERHIYQDTFTVTDTAAYHHISFDLCCRNLSILNGTGNFHITSSFQPGNHTATFLSAPIVKFPKDTLWAYNPMPSDFEGDSLYWNISAPFRNATDTVNGYYPPSANPGGDLSIDSATGVVSWNPSQVGNFIFSVSVAEWRGGVLVGEIKRDMQVLVVADTSQLLISPPINVISANGQNTFDLTACAANSFTISATTSDSLATLSMMALGEPFQVDPTGATFTTVLKKSGAGIMEGHFQWNPDPALNGNSYRMMVRISDGNFSYDYSVTLNVTGVVSVEEMGADASHFAVFPNPAQAGLHWASDFYQGPVSLRLLGMDGRLINQAEFTSGERFWALPTVEAGAYVLEIQYEEKSERQRVLFR